MIKLDVMRNKKLIFAILCTFLLIVFAYYYFVVYASYHEVDIHATYKSVASFEELERNADVILVGSAIPNTEKTVTTNFSNGNLQDIYTITSFQVDKVIKQPKDLTISDTFIFNQPGGTIQTLTGKYRLKIEDYDNLKPEKTYIVYLGKNNSGGYSLMYSHNGRYALDDDNQEDNQHQNPLLKEAVLSKYKK